MYWVTFFDGSSKVMSDFELDEIIENEDSRDSIVEIKTWTRVSFLIPSR